MSGETCCERTWPAHSMRSYPCRNKGKVVRGGKPYCGMHDPEKIAAKRAEGQAKFDAQQRENERRMRMIRAAPKLLAALKAIICDHGGTLCVGGKDPIAIAAREAIAEAEGKGK